MLLVVSRLNNAFRRFFDLIAEGRTGYVVKYEMDKGQTFPTHYHPNVDEYIITLEGTFLFLYADQQKILEGLNLIFIPRKTLHTLKILSHSARYLVIRERDDEFVVI